MYEGLGYAYVDTPWVVGEQAVAATLPPARSGFTVGHPTLAIGCLVGSAEQGFLQMMLDGTLRPGRYCSAGPCFRDEEVVDELHAYSFFKLELLSYGSPSPQEVTAMVQDASWVHASLFNACCTVERTADGCDLTYGGVEVGSYGQRSVGQHAWAYGTGLALPRAFKATRGLPK